MNKIAALIDALYAGRQLADPATWKKRQNLVAALTAIAGAALALLPLFGLHLEMSDADLATVVGAVAVVVGLFNGYTTTATTQKIGLRPPDPPAPGPGDTEPGRGHELV